MIGLTRRDAAAGLGAAVAAPGAGGPLSGVALQADVVRYAGFGDHRSGGPADRATTDWIAETLRRAALRVSRSFVAHPVPVLGAAHLEVEGAPRLDGFPLWPPAVGARVVDGLLSRTPAPGVVTWLDFGQVVDANLTFARRAAVTAAFAAGALAVVATTGSLTGDVVALNTPPDLPAWPGPALLLAGRHVARLGAAATARARVTVRVASMESPRSGSETVLAERSGRGEPLVITTPKTGWFRCAGERGSGLAIALALARVLPRVTDAPLIFAFTTAHELDGLGAREFLRHYAPAPDRTRLWLHIGANVAVREARLRDGGVRSKSRRPKGYCRPTRASGEARYRLRGTAGLRHAA